MENHIVTLTTGFLPILSPKMSKSIGNLINELYLLMVEIGLWKKRNIKGFASFFNDREEKLFSTFINVPIINDSGNEYIFFDNRLWQLDIYASDIKFIHDSTFMFTTDFMFYHLDGMFEKCRNCLEKKISWAKVIKSKYENFYNYMFEFLTRRANKIVKIQTIGGLSYFLQTDEVIEPALLNYINDDLNIFVITPNECAKMKKIKVSLDELKEYIITM